ncbi:permease [Clostridium malenominatum]|uniref:Permease n=1 Tax=Clostridium malenominatum TaxID=1539 RepID=A0ABN1J300_9CLOT
MDIFTLVLWILTGIGFFISIRKDKKKTLNSVYMARSMMKNMVGEIIGVLFLIGLITTLIPPNTIRSFVNGSNTLISTVVSALVGSITLIPAFVAFPLVGSLVNMGVNIIPIVAFLTTLTMVGIVTFPLEKREFGVKFTLYRNLFSFLFAIIIAMVIGVIL